MCDILLFKNEQFYHPALKYMGGILNSDDMRIVEKCVFNGLIDKVVNILYSPNT